MRVEVIIAAGGVGRRFAKDQPKQFCLLKGKPILSWSISRFEECPLVGGIILVVPRGMERYTRQSVLSPCNYQKVKTVVKGGKERRDSVMQGLNMLETDTDTVLVHDGVRPIISQELIIKVIQATERWEAVVPGLPVREMVKRVGRDNLVKETLDRKKIYLIQTPQGFKKDIICQAYGQARKRGWQANDDASLVERLGTIVKMIPGEETNVKITSPQDLMMTELLLGAESKES
ncbi:2-C-methyl-D-erythritol 4-phosphate cytidylyltransferase [subsurface metagenome]